MANLTILAAKGGESDTLTVPESVTSTLFPGLGDAEIVALFVDWVADQAKVKAQNTAGPAAVEALMDQLIRGT